MKKKIVLIVLLVVLMLGIAFWGQWYADKNPEQTPAMKVLEMKTQELDLGKGVKLEMVLLPEGTFQMGNENEDWLSSMPAGERFYSKGLPMHSVDLSEFWIGKYEVTQEQYETVMGNNPSSSKGAKHPGLSSKYSQKRDLILFLRREHSSLGLASTFWRA